MSKKSSIVKNIRRQKIVDKYVGIVEEKEVERKLIEDRLEQKKQQILQVIKKIKNTGVKYDNFQEDVGSWDKYGSEDYSTNYDISDILDD